MRNRTTTRRRVRPAYTLIEVLITVTIMGLAAAIIVPNMMQGGTLGVQAGARMIISDMLFAQNEAMAQQSNRRVVFDTANNTYRVEKYDSSTSSWVLEYNPTLKGGGDLQNYEMNFDEDGRFSGVQIVSAEFGSESQIEFDDQGIPSSGGTIRLQFQTHIFDIKVAPFTGRITVERVSS